MADGRTSVDRIFRNARLATLAADRPATLVEPGAVAMSAGRIVAVGSEVETGYAAAEEIDLGGRLVTPGLIDCHTHLVHAGSRADEFERRLEGVSYTEIAKSGGGILSTVRATRAATEDELVATALPRLDSLLAEGVTTIEIKSGYGLDLETEIRMLRAAKALAAQRQVSVATTYLAAHALPPDFVGRADAYIDMVASEYLPAVAREGLADAVDAFCETIAFTPAQTARLFDAAAKLGLPVKLHADQLSDLGGARLAAEHRALSADHLEYTGEDGAAAMAASGTVAVLLPGAFYMLNETRRPPVDAFRRLGVKMAVATDCNPGTSPLTSLLLAMNMAATLFRLTVAECLAGVTREAARALDKLDETGTIEPGKWCDLAVWDVETPAELVYRLGARPLYTRIWRGEMPRIAA
jgi:imidazolonepropionase